MGMTGGSAAVPACCTALMRATAPSARNRVHAGISGVPFRRPSPGCPGDGLPALVRLSSEDYLCWGLAVGGRGSAAVPLKIFHRGALSVAGSGVSFIFGQYAGGWSSKFKKILHLAGWRG